MATLCSVSATPRGSSSANSCAFISSEMTHLRGWNLMPRISFGSRRWVRLSVASEVRKNETQTKTPPTADASPLVKAAWYGSEAFGKLVAAFRPPGSLEAEEDQQDIFDGPLARKDVVELIRKDYDRSYFVTAYNVMIGEVYGALDEDWHNWRDIVVQVTVHMFYGAGNMAMGIYEPQCEFADPFVSFKGIKRFKQNVSNLGSFMEESTLKVTDWQEYEDRIYARWRFNCVLALPWRPILAATGSTEYYFDEKSGKICKHVEIWDISPADGVRQLFKPNPKRKTKL